MHLFLLTHFSKRYEGPRTAEALAEFVNSEGGKSLPYCLLNIFCQREVT